MVFLDDSINLRIQQGVNQKFMKNLYLFQKSKYPKLKMSKCKESKEVSTWVQGPEF